MAGLLGGSRRCREEGPQMGRLCFFSCPVRGGRSLHLSRSLSLFLPVNEDDDLSLSLSLFLRVNEADDLSLSLSLSLFSFSLPTCKGGR